MWRPKHRRRNAIYDSRPVLAASTVSFVTTGDIRAGLNPEQLRAVETLRGPVCILAGAGTGKTTTITRRIANQVVTGTFSATQILAVSFTTKAAEELSVRLAEIGARRVQVRTFHSAASRQLQ